MKTIIVEDGKSVLVGKEGESRYTELLIPVPADLVGYDIHLFCLYPQDLESVEIPETDFSVSDGFIHWILTDTATAKAGISQIQVRYIDGSRVIKSPVYQFNVLNSIC